MSVPVCSHLVPFFVLLQTSPLSSKDSAVIAKYGVELLCDPDEGGPTAQLLQFSRPYVGAGGADPTQDVPYCYFHRALVGNFDCLPF